MRWRNPEDLPPIPIDLESPSQLFEVPQQAKVERNVEIYRGCRAGESSGEIGNEYGLSSTHVRMIVQEIAEVIRRFHEAR